MKKIIVFDFDKTLTYKDTLFGFFKYAAKRNVFYPLKLLILYKSLVFSKLGILNNSQLKNIGIKLFLKNLDADDLKNKFLNFHKTITYNKLFYDLKYYKNTNYYIVSASFQDYLRPIFPNPVFVLGSLIKYKNKKANCLAFNCFEEAKIDALKKLNITQIDVLYTDSYSDVALAKIAKQTVVVNGDKTTTCNSLQEFNQYFNKLV